MVGRSEVWKRVYKFECQIRRDFPLIQSNDKTFLAILAYDKSKAKDCVNVYHAKRGVFLHRVLLKYHQFKRPLKFMPFRDNCVVIVDSEKGNIVDLRNKCFIRSIRHWTGQSIGEESRYGLSAPNRSAHSRLVKLLASQLDCWHQLVPLTRRNASSWNGSAKNMCLTSRIKYLWLASTCSMMNIDLRHDLSKLSGHAKHFNCVASIIQFQKILLQFPVVGCATWTWKMDLWLSQYWKVAWRVSLRFMQTLLK